MSDRPKSASIQEALRNALEQIDAGHLPSQLLQRAREAATANDSREFVLALTELFENQDLTEKLDSSHFTEFASLARQLELEEVGAHVLKVGSDLHKEDSTLRWELLRFMGTSSLRSIRHSAREALEAVLEISWDNGTISISAKQLKEEPRYFGLLMDLLLRDESPDISLNLGEAAQKVAPDDPVILRNYGRALQAVGRGEEAVGILKKATWLPGAGDVEPNYLATALANLNDQRGALEADLLASTRDPDDGRNFIRSAIALALAVDEEVLEQEVRDALYRPEIASRMILNALSCRLLSENDRTMASTLVRSFEIADDPILIEHVVREVVDDPAVKGPISLDARRADAERWYSMVKTDRTTPPSGDDDPETPR